MSTPRPIHLSQFNASPPGRYWVRWVADDGLAVEGWRTKTEGVRQHGRDVGPNDKGAEQVRQDRLDAYSRDFNKKPKER